METGGGPDLSLELQFAHPGLDQRCSGEIQCEPSVISSLPEAIF